MTAARHDAQRVASGGADVLRVASGGADVLRVALDGIPLIGERTGVGRMTELLAEGLARRPDVALAVYAVSRRGRHELARLLPAGTRAATSPLPARVVHRMWSVVSRPRIEHWTGRVDVVHGTNFVAPPARAPTVVTIHDLAFVRFPEWCRPETASYVRLVRRALDQGAHVHAVSDRVAVEVQECFAVDAERVTRIYSPMALDLGTGDPASGQALAGATRYVLALGTVEPRKNLARLVAAFDRVAAHQPDVVLVVAGPDGWGMSAFHAALASARAHDRIRRLGYVSESQRRDLLAGAAVLAYPSLYEGFGHPPLEAMAAGVPVVTSNADAIPEAVGEAAVLCDPTDVESIAEGLDRVLGDEALRSELRARGYERARLFGAHDRIDDFIQLYRRLMMRI